MLAHLDECRVLLALDAHRGLDLPLAEYMAGQPGARPDVRVPAERGLGARLEQRLAGRNL